MTQTMEAWLCADPEALARYFGEGFEAGRLPQRDNLEDEPKEDLDKKLAAATRDSRRGRYQKGAHLELLGLLSPARVSGRCPGAGEFIALLTQKPRRHGGRG